MRTGMQLAGVRALNQSSRRRRLAMAAAAVVPALLSSTAAFAADYIYTGGGTGTLTSPVSGNFSTGFTPSIAGAGNGDVLRFNGITGSTYTATNDLAAPVIVNGFRIDGNPNITISSSATSLVRLSGSNPFLDFNNGNGTLTPPTLRTNFEFTSSGFIVKSSSPAAAYTPVLTGGTLTLDAGTNNVMSLGDSGGDNTAELNIASGIVGSGNLLLQNNIGGFPGGVATQTDTSAWGTLQLGSNPGYSGNFNIAFGRVVTGASNPFGVGGTLTIAIGSANTSGGSLTLGGTSGDGGVNGNGGFTAGGGSIGAYGNLANGSTGIVIPNAVNLGGAINGVYGYAINNFNGVNTFSGNVTLTQTQVRVQSNTGNNMTSNAGAGLIFSGNVSESVTGAAFNVSGNGDLTFSGANNTFTGGVNISGGVLLFTTSLPATGTIYMANGAFAAPANLPTATAILTSGRVNNTSTGAVLIAANDSANADFTNYPGLGLGALKGATVTYSGTITPGANGIRIGGGGGTLNIGAPLTQAASLVVGYPGSVGIVTLTGTQAYTGNTNLSGGYLAVTSGQIPTASQIYGFGGGIRLLDNAGTDFTATRTIIDQGGFFLDTNGFDFTLNSKVVPGGTGTTYGDFSKAGGGTLTLGNTIECNVFYVRNNSVVYANGSSSVITNHNYTSIGVFPGDNVTLTLDNGAKYAGVGDFNLADVAGSTLYNASTDSATVNLLNTTGSATITTLTAGNVFIGKGSTIARNLAVGVLNQGPSTNLSSTGNVYVGYYGQGTYNQTGGTLSLTGNLTVGRFSSTVGNYNMTGGTLNVTGNIFLPEDGVGNMTVGAGTVVNTNRIALARSTDPVTTTGVFTQNGGVVTTTGVGTAGGILFGGTAGNNPLTALATGTYNLNGGVLKTGSISQTSNAVGAIRGTFNFNGGTLQASTGVATPFIGGLTAANVLAGGAVIDNNSLNITLAQNFAHAGGATVDGGMKLAGTGVVTLSSTGSTYTGPTAITAGTLRLAATTTTTATIPAAAIQAYYTFENPDTLLNDASPNGNTLAQPSDFFGAPLGTVAFSTNAPPSSAATGIHAGSVQLGSGAYLLPQSGAFPTGVPTLNQPYTIAAWINGSGITTTNNSSLNGYGIVGWGNYGSGSQVTALRTANVGGGTANGIAHYWWANDVNAVVPGGNGSVINNWHYVLATYDPTTSIRTVYVDGVPVSQDSPTGHNAQPTNFAVGATNGFTEIFDGNLADVLISNTAFSAGQAAIARSGNLSSSFTSTTPGGQLPLTTVVQISSGATFDVNGNNQTIGGLTGPTGGFVTLGSGTLTVNPTVAGQFDGVISGTGNLNVGGTAALTVGGINTYTGATNVATGGKLIFAASTGSAIAVRTRTGGINIASGAVVQIAAPTASTSRTLLVTPSLLIAGSTNAWTGQLDITSNDLDLPGATIGTVVNQVRNGLGLGTFPNPGQGITSSTALANSTHVTTIGVVSNSQLGAATFDGQTVGATDVLVKYTYFGDANFDGKVDGSDYTRIDNGFLTPALTGWYNGDFNYDSVVDGSDYSLIDNAYNRQTGANGGVSPSSLVATPTGLVAGASAVPEPASITTVMLLGVGGLVARRRRR